jgi:hypothetical protein
MARFTHLVIGMPSIRAAQYTRGMRSGRMQGEYIVSSFLNVNDSKELFSA